MKKIFLIAAIASLSTSAMAENGLSTKLEGKFNFESGMRNQSKVPADGKNVSQNRKKFAFDSEAGIYLTASNTVDSMTYGARLGIQTSAQATSSLSYNGSHLFLQSDYGKWEMGAGFNSYSQMSISGLDVARGSGDHWERYWYEPTNINFIPTPGDDNNAPDTYRDYGTEGARNVTYFTPVLKDLIQFGISYTPDTTNVGIGSFSKDSTPSSRIRTFEVGNYTYSDKESYKDLISYGAVVTHHLADNTDLKVALTGETGKATKGTKMLTTEYNATKRPAGTPYKLSNLKRYNIGAILNVNKWSFAGSYTNQKGYTNAEINKGNNKTYLYTAGAAYQQGPVAVSFVYSVSNALKNKVSSYTLGTDYKLAPGFVPYAEVTYFQAKGKQLPIYGASAASYKTKGTIALIGATLKF